MAQSCLHRLDCICGQLLSFEQELQRMHGLEFPYEHSRLAIQEVQSTFNRVRRFALFLDKSSDPATIESLCQSAFGYLENSLGILGFILRSTNVRNAFEFHGPMLRLTRLVLGTDAKLLLSSEWEISPFLLLTAKVLPADYVLIGQPASESSNPFLLPLAGHELGHSVWSKFQLRANYDKNAKAEISARLKKQWPAVKSLFGLTCKPEELENDLGGTAVLSMAVELCCRQVEEAFCDCFGVRMFGTSYFYAFGYLLSPLASPVRSPIYPDFKDRAADQVKAAHRFGYEEPDKYSDLFNASAPVTPGADAFLLDIVDAVRKSMIDQVILEVEKIANASNLPTPSQIPTQNCFNTLRHFVPCLKASCLADITNAAWQARLAEPFFSKPSLEKDKIRHLSELVLKSIEVFEIEQCLQDQKNSATMGAQP
jgi:hypothetical protein